MQTAKQTLLLRAAALAVCIYIHNTHAEPDARTVAPVFISITPPAPKHHSKNNQHKIISARLGVENPPGINLEKSMRNEECDCLVLQTILDKTPFTKSTFLVYLLDYKNY
jgi:hypothetical protein